SSPFVYLEASGTPTTSTPDPERKPASFSQTAVKSRICSNTPIKMTTSKPDPSNAPRVACETSPYRRAASTHFADGSIPYRSAYPRFRNAAKRPPVAQPISRTAAFLGHNCSISDAALSAFATSYGDSATSY